LEDLVKTKESALHDSESSAISMAVTEEAEHVADIFKQLQEISEAARKEAATSYEKGFGDGFAAGFLAAQQRFQRMISEASPPEQAKVEKAVVEEKHKPKGRYAPDKFVPRIPRGTAKASVEETLRQHNPKALGPTEIQFLLKRDKAMDLPYTSVRRALDFLVAGGIAEEVGETKTWRLANRLRSVK